MVPLKNNSSFWCDWLKMRRKKFSCSCCSTVIMLHISNTRGENGSLIFQHVCVAIAVPITFIMCILLASHELLLTNWELEILVLTLHQVVKCSLTKTYWQSKSLESQFWLYEWTKPHLVEPLRLCTVFEPTAWDPPKIYLWYLLRLPANMHSTLGRK